MSGNRRHYESAVKGLNLLGKCTKKVCEAFLKKNVVCRVGFGSYNISDVAENAKMSILFQKPFRSKKDAFFIVPFQSRSKTPQWPIPHQNRTNRAPWLCQIQERKLKCTDSVVEYVGDD